MGQQFTSIPSTPAQELFTPRTKFATRTFSGNMHFSHAFFVAAFAGATLCAPVADPQLLSSLSPNVVSLLGALGLGSIAQPVGGIITAVGDNVKRDVDALNEVEKRQLLAALSPSVVQLLQNFGLGSLAPVGDILTAVGDNVKRDVEAMNENERRQLLSSLSPSVVQLLSNFGLGSIATPVGGIITAVGDNVKRDVAAIEDLNDIERRQLLSGLSQPVVDLLTALGLGSLGTPIGGILTAVSGSVKRSVDDLNDIERRQLLSGLSQPIVDLLTALGLGSI